MKKYRITYETKQGSVYSYIDDGYEDGLQEGEWFYPFPNEQGNSTAYGLAECLAQSDNCPPIFFEEELNRIKVEEVL